jgi:hypothetical protein
MLPELSDIAEKFFEGRRIRPDNVSVRIQACRERRNIFTHAVEISGSTNKRMKNGTD